MTDETIASTETSDAAGIDIAELAEATPDGVRERGANQVLVRLSGRELEVRRHDSRLVTVHDPALRGTRRIDQVAVWKTTRFRGRLAPMGDRSCSPEWTRPFVEAALGEGGL